MRDFRPIRSRHPRLLECGELLAEGQDSLLALRLGLRYLDRLRLHHVTLDGLLRHGLLDGFLRDLLFLRLRLRSPRAAVPADAGATPSSCARRDPAPRAPRPARAAAGRSAGRPARAAGRRAATPRATCGNARSSSPRRVHGMTSSRVGSSPSSRSMIQSSLRSSSSSCASKRSSSSTPAWCSCCVISSTSDLSPVLDLAHPLLEGFHAAACAAHVRLRPRPPRGRPRRARRRRSREAARARRTRRSATGAACARRSGLRARRRPRAGRATRPSSFSRASASCGRSAWLSCDRYGFHEITRAGIEGCRRRRRGPRPASGHLPAAPSRGPPARSSRRRPRCTSPSPSSPRRTAATCRPSTVISREARASSCAAASTPTIGRASTARSGSISCVPAIADLRDARDQFALHEQLIPRDHHDHGLLRLRLGHRLRNLDTLRVLHDLHVRGVHEQERHHHRQDVDQRNQVELSILTLDAGGDLSCRDYGSSRLMARLRPRCR